MARELELTWKIYPRMLLISRDHEDIKWLSHDTLSIRRPGPFLLSLRLAHTCSHHAFFAIDLAFNKRNRFFTTLKFQRAIKNAGVGSGPQ